MEKANRYVTVAYKLYTIENDEKEFIEEASADGPYQFITGFGTTLESFEDQIMNLQPGDPFEFTVPAAEAYGDYNDEHVLELAKSMFKVDGHFDAKHIREGEIVPLQNSDGRQFNAVVTAVGTDTVTVDLNHPLAGEDLIFAGQVIENRPATPEEIQGMLNMLSGDGCSCCSEGSCGSGGCGGSCH